MTLAVADDRLSHLLMLGTSGVRYSEARRRLDSAALVLSAGACAHSAWGQAALLTIAECGVRMFPGGVFLAAPFEEDLIVGHRARAPLYRYLRQAGCRTGELPANAITLHVGSEESGGYRGLQCWADRWTAIVSSKPAATARPGNEISGALTGALGVTECFRIAVLNDKLAGRRTQRLSALTPGSATEAALELEYLPSDIRLLGLGNLGQGTLWMLGLLPYADTAKTTLVLQDIDTVETGNLQVQLLTRPSWLEHMKTRCAAAWSETLGFQTRIIEEPFNSLSRRSPDQPGLLLVGVDKLEPRRAAADANFDLVIDAGLGASASEVFDMRLHSFPGSRSAEQAWPAIETAPEPSLVPALEELVEQGLIDRCGAVTIAGRSLGVPSTAVAAAAIQVAQACRAIVENRHCDLIDLSLVDCRRAKSHEATLDRASVIPFTLARRRS
jgi:molybdopterin/thiamine biosynthesis adenylyltransferase